MRTYSEKEIALILREAGELQFAGGGAGKDHDGYSLEEIQGIGRELGISADHVAEAALRVSGRNDGSKQKKNMQARRTIPGHLSDEAWQELVDELRETVGGIGASSRTGSSREWKGGTSFIDAVLTATPGKDGTALTLTMSQESGTALAWTFSLVISLLVPLLTAIALSKAGEGGIVIFSAVVAILTAIFFTTREILRAWDKKNRIMLFSLVQKFANVAADHGATDGSSHIQAVGTTTEPPSPEHMNIHSEGG